MSEPRKEENKPKPKSKILIAILIGVIIIGVTLGGAYVFVYLVYYSQVEPESAQRIPPNVIPEIANPINPDKFNVANFDRCVKLLIDYVKTYGIFESTQSKEDKIKLNDILSQYNDLNCPLVENQLSQTDQYKNRNNNQ
mgnify:FL=1